MVIFHIVMYSYVRLAPLATKEAVTNMNVWVREVHGPNGSAPCGPWVLGLVLLSLLTAFAGASVGPEPVVIIMPSVLYVAGCCCRNFCRFFLRLPEKADTEEWDVAKWDMMGQLSDLDNGYIYIYI